MKIIILIITVLFASNLTAQENMQSKKINEIILGKLNQIEGDKAVFFLNLETGEEIKFNEKEKFHAASTMKVPVMLELYRQASVGLFSLIDSIIVRNEFKSIADGSRYKLNIADDSDNEIYDLIGKKLTVYELNHRMITKSSNLATNILIEFVGADNIMKTMKSIGANDIRVLRGVEDIPAYRKGMNNTTTAKDLCLVLKSILDYKVVNEKLSNEILSVLEAQEHNDIIPEQLPKNVKVAHKTGWITGVMHDAGVVILPDERQYILVLLTKNLTNEEKSKKILQEISLEFYKYFLR